MYRVIAALIILSSLMLAACGGTTTSTGQSTTVVDVATATTGTQAAPTTAAQPTTTTVSVPPTDTAAPAPTDTPLPPTDTAVPPTATAAAGKLEVTQFTYYTTTYGNYVYVVGAVQNSGQVSLTDAQIVASALNAAGDTIATGSDIMLLGVDKIDPGVVLPFRVPLDNITEPFAKIDIQTQASVYDANGLHFQDPAEGLTVEGTKLGKPSKYSGPKFTGRVVNGGTTAVTLVHVLAAGYGDDGKILETADSYTTIDPLQAGGNAPFEVDFSRSDVEIAKVDVIASAHAKK